MQDHSLLPQIYFLVIYLSYNILSCIWLYNYVGLIGRWNKLRNTIVSQDNTFQNVLHMLEMIH